MTVYFISTKGRADAPIKIGTTADLDRRLVGLQTGCHDELEVLAFMEGGRDAEAYLHEALAAYRIRGEWFRRSPEVEQAIARARLNGAASLPFSDAGQASATRLTRTDTEDAQRLVRQIMSAVAPNEVLNVALARVCRQLNRICPSMTESRLRSIYNGEPRRIDAFEMVALQQMQQEINVSGQARDSLALVPIISEYLSEVDAPLTARQSAIVERYLQRCTEALSAGGAR